MHEDTRWKVVAGAGLVTLSLALYTVHYWLFHDAEHILVFGFGEIAFIPLEVLIVTLIIDQMLEAREQRRRMEKMNMIIGTFFSDMGTPLLDQILRADPGIDAFRARLVVRETWKKQDFMAMKDALGKYDCSIDMHRIDLETLRTFLLKNGDLVFRLAENPAVLEHESFSDLLLAISHLTEELKVRDNMSALSTDDLAHLATDIRRIYLHLIPEWLRYMEYLQVRYPFLFNLAMRRNPFDTAASVMIGPDQ